MFSTTKVLRLAYISAAISLATISQTTLANNIQNFSNSNQAAGSISMSLKKDMEKNNNQQLWGERKFDNQGINQDQGKGYWIYYPSTANQPAAKSQDWLQSTQSYPLYLD